MAKPDDLYGTYGNVASVEPSGAGIGGMSVRANPDAFGAQVGKAVETVGDQATELADRFQKQATETKTNDDYANKYVPAAAALREKFDSLPPTDKVAGYEDFTKNLNDLHNQFTSDAAGPYGKQLMSGLIVRHVESEVNGAKTELVKAQKTLGYDSTYAVLKANNDTVAKDYNNQDAVDATLETNNAHITKQLIDDGHDPNTPQGAATIQQAQRDAAASTGITLLDSAIANGDVQSAYKLRTDFAPVLPGFQQLHYDNLLHEQAVQQVGTYGSKAVQSGDPIPNIVGSPPIQVKAAVANTAQANGVDPNHALTVARIESNYGQNVGSRGDIGQTGKGGDINEQASNMVTELKKSETVADTALGRKSEPWEQYLCYQQGAGGGPALLKASEDNPEAKAIDVLTPVYGGGSRGAKLAQQAILNNGGNATMTSNDFMDLIHQKYDDNARRAACDIPKDGKLGDAIIAAHSTTGETVQPAASPRQALLNFDSKAPKMLGRINAIPDPETRNGVMDAFKRDRSVYEAASNAYMANITSEAQKMFVDPKFTDVDQMPLEMRQVIASDKPELMREMRSQAESNLKHEGLVTSRDAVNNTPNFYDTIQRVLTPTGEDGMDNPNRIVTENELNGMLGRPRNGISMKDYSDSKEALGFSGDWKDFLAKNMKQITNANGNVDGLGQQRAVEFYQSANKKRHDILANGGKESDLTDPDSKDYLGTLVPLYSASRDQQVGNTAAKMRTEAQKTQAPQRQPGETLDQYAKRTGL